MEKAESPRVVEGDCFVPMFLNGYAWNGTEPVENWWDALQFRGQATAFPECEAETNRAEALVGVTCAPCYFAIEDADYPNRLIQKEFDRIHGLQATEGKKGRQSRKAKSGSPSPAKKLPKEGQ